MKSLMGCLAAVLLSVAWASAAQGQSGSQAGADTGTPAPARVIGGPLAGIDVLQMSVAPLSDQARACGLEGSIILDSRSEEHTSELQSLTSISYAVLSLQKK